MNVRQLITDDSAVSPVIGVVLMVAITVLLAATAAAFFLGLTDQNGESPQVAIKFDYASDNTGNHDVLKIKHAGGDELQSENVKVAVRDAPINNGVVNDRFTWQELDGKTSSSVAAGMAVNVSQASLNGTGSYSATQLTLNPATVEVIWDDPEKSRTFTLAEWSA